MANASIIELLSGFRSGRLLDHCNEELTKLAAAVAEFNAPGEITITVKLNPKAEGQVIAVARVKTKAPTKPVGDAIFYVTEDGQLGRDDPRQGALPIFDSTPTGRRIKNEN